jgi:hypothetical protein
MSQPGNSEEKLIKDILTDQRGVNLDTLEQVILLAMEKWMGVWWGPEVHLHFPKPKYALKSEKNKPAGSVVLKEGAAIISGDGENERKMRPG